LVGIDEGRIGKMTHRVLVVEDEPGLRDSMARFLRSEGFVVDEASDFQGAVFQLSSRTYHVALVDIMLGGEERTNRDGLRVIDEINNLGEGTSVVVMSLHNDPQVSADTLQVQNVFRYISKSRIIKEGMEIVLADVRKAEAQTTLHLFGWSRTTGDRRIARSCLSYLAGDGPQLIISFNKWSQLLGPKISPTLLEEAITEFVTPWAPLLPLHDSTDYISADESLKCLIGTFWSKSFGLAVTLVICTDEAVARVAEGALGSVLGDAQEFKAVPRYTKRSLTGLVFERPDLKRTAFSERIRPSPDR
jgi:CheY-like chemotaxis protein